MVGGSFESVKDSNEDWRVKGFVGRVVGQFESGLGDLIGRAEIVSMEKETRAKLLRQRFKAKGGFPFVGKAREPKPVMESRRKVYMPWPDIIADTKRAPGWMKEGDAAPSLTPQTRRTAKQSALGRIADRWDERRLDPSWGRRNS